MMGELREYSLEKGISRRAAENGPRLFGFPGLWLLTAGFFAGCDLKDRIAVLVFVGDLIELFLELFVFYYHGFMICRLQA